MPSKLVMPIPQVIVSLVKVGNAIEVGNANTTCVIQEVSSIKVSICLFEFFYFSNINKNLRFDFLISSF
jgi:hypothetical protein